MFSFFTSNKKSTSVHEKRQKILSTRLAMERAMRKHGVNSDIVREFDKQLDKLEEELKNCA